jgi:two-component system response regulator ChvI
MAKAVDPSSSSSVHVVLVDDDRAFLRVFAVTLQAAGYRTECFEDSRQALKALQRDIRPDACVLDWQMPDLDGLELLKALRGRGIAIPVLFLTSHGQPIFEEAALDAGAVDFVDKSRGPAIILHRLSLALTRQPVQRGPVGADSVVGALVLSQSSKRVRWHGSHVPLSHSEFDVIELLAKNAGRDVGYREIYDAARGSGFLAGQGEDGYRANVRAIVKRIRRKFEQLDPAFTALQNYPGFGYRWHQDD